MNHVTSPNEPFPAAADLAAATRSHTQGHWKISARKLPISRAAEIDAMTDKIGIPIPEMIFGDNEVSLEHVPTGWAIRFAAEDALDAVDKTGRDRLQVAHAGDWARSRETSSAAGIRDVRPYDWSYSTPYQGTQDVPDESKTSLGAPGETPTRLNGEASNEGRAEPEASINEGRANEPEARQGNEPEARQGNEPEARQENEPEARQRQENETGQPNGTSMAAPPPTTTASTSTSTSSLSLRPDPSTDSLPLALLRRRDPILFHHDVILYESELDDNGISVLRVKVRVMPQRLLLLSRYYLRLDHVVVRVRDTRVYVDFATDTVLREYTAREDTFANAQRSLAMTGLRPDAVIVAMRDANQVAERLPIVEHRMDRLELANRSPTR